MRSNHDKKHDKRTALLWTLLGAVIGVVLSSSSSRWNEDATQVTRTLSKEETVGVSYEDEEEEEENPVLEYTIVVGIVLILIFLTILFEYSKDSLEEGCSQTMRPIVESLFGELTVLGFLSIFTFVVTKTGFFSRLGEILLGHERHEELLELFESVHYTIFFIMVFFVIQVLVLLKETNETAHQWLEWERLVHNPDIEWSARAVHYHQVTSTTFAVKRWIRSYTSVIPWCRNNAQREQEEVLYKALRDEFVLDRQLDLPFAPSDNPVQDDFNFARYLEVCQVSLVQKVVHLKISTWVLFAVGVVLYYCLVLAVHCDPKVLAWMWVAFAWLLCFFNIQFERHVVRIITAFASKGVYIMAHHGRVPVPANSESAGLLEGHDNEDYHLLPDWCHVNIASYISNRPYLAKFFAGGVPNRQQALYWLDRKGPKLFLFILQFDLLFVGIFAAIQCIQVGPYMLREQPTWAFWLYLVLGTIPILNIAVNKKHLVAFLTPVCSLGVYRRPQVIASVIREGKMAQTVRAFIVLYKLRRFAMQAEPIKEHPSARIHYSAVFDNHEIAQVGRLFDEFDLDGCGSISLEEFGVLMSRLGANLTDQQLQNMVDSLDTGKDGSVNRDEFIQWYADHSQDNDISEKEFAHFMFKMFDTDDSGEVTIGEFKKKLDHVTTRFTVDEIGMLVNELDKNNGGAICEEEFEHLIHKYYPQELVVRHHE